MLFISKTLITLEEGDDMLLLPEIFGSSESVDGTIHGHLEENGTHDLLSVELGDLMTRVLISCTRSTFSLITNTIDGVDILFDSVALQSLRGGSTRLVESCDEALAVSGLFELLSINFM